MSDALYERYKEALRRGHVAALRGHSDAALTAYGEAARIAPDRALPLVGVGSVLARLGKPAEALAAYDAALDRAPTDEAGLRGRADALAALGRRADAADTLDRLVPVLDGAGRLADATDAAGRALELAESRDRRHDMRALTDRLREEPANPATSAVLEHADALLQSPVGPDAVDEPPGEVAPPFDPAQATADVEDAVEGGDPELVRTTALAAAAGHRADGHASAAIDVCYQALASNPADPRLHLVLAEVYLDRGWRAAASDKLVLLARLADLADDADTQTRVCAIASERLPEDARLSSVCA
jgi:tetratricopeptide (TPR) repeat protein